MINGGVTVACEDTVEGWGQGVVEVEVTCAIVGKQCMYTGQPIKHVPFAAITNV